MFFAKCSLASWSIFGLVLLLSKICTTGSEYLLLGNDDIDYHQAKRPEKGAALEGENASARTMQNSKSYESQITKIKKQIFMYLPSKKSTKIVHLRTISRREIPISKESITNTLSVPPNQLYEASNLSDFADPLDQKISPTVNAGGNHTAESVKTTDTLSSSPVLKNTQLIRSASPFYSRVPFVSVLGRAEGYRESYDKSVSNVLDSFSQQTPLAAQVTQTSKLVNWLKGGSALSSEEAQRTEPTKPRKSTISPFTRFGTNLLSKHSSIVATKTSPKDMKRIQINSEVAKMISDNVKWPSKSIYMFKSEMYRDNVISSESSVDSIGSQNAQHAPHSHVQIAKANRNNALPSSAPTKQRSASHDGDWTTKQVTKKSFNVGCDSILQSKIISASLQGYSSYQFSKTSLKNALADYRESQVPYTKDYSLNSRARLANGIGKSRMTLNQPRSTIRSLKVETINTLLYPTVPSTTMMSLQNHESMGHQISQSYDSDHLQYTQSSKRDHISPITTLQNRGMTDTDTEIIQKWEQVPASQVYSSSSVTESYNDGTILALSMLNVDNAATSTIQSTEQFDLNEDEIFTSLSSVHTPALFSSVEVSQEHAPFYLSHSLNVKYEEELLPSLSASTSISTLTALPSGREEDLDYPFAKTMANTENEPLGDSIDLDRMTSSLSTYFTDSQPEQEVELSEHLLPITSITDNTSYFVSNSTGNPKFSTQRRIDSETRLPLLPNQSITLDKSMKKTIQLSTRPLQSYQQTYLSDHQYITKSISQSHLAKSVIPVLLASSSRYPGHSRSFGAYSQMPSIIVRPTKSSSVYIKPSKHSGGFGNECTYRLIKNIQDTSADDELKFEMQDILSLKIKRVIAVRWPYTGYLGKAGFLHRGLVVQTRDGRYWYNHMQNKEDKIYVVYLDSIAELHHRVEVIYSQDVNDEGTLGEHVGMWGISVGMYFRTCYGKKWRG